MSLRRTSPKLSRPVPRRFLQLMAGTLVACPSMLFSDSPVQPNSFAAAPAAPAPAGRMASFAMKNTVTGPDQRVLAEHSVLFQDGRIYDFDDSMPRFITVIDLAAQNVVLLDKQTQVKCSISTNVLLQAAARVEAAANEPEAAGRFGVNASVFTSEDEASFVTEYGADATGKVRYEITAVEANDRLTSIAYGQFIDWASRLDMARETGPPPFARMAIHRDVQAAGRIPASTRVVVDQDGRQLVLNGRHQKRQLTGNDELRINEAAGMLVLFKEVALADFPK